MKFFINFLLSLTLLVFSFSCTKKRPARIIDNSHKVYAKNGKSKYRSYKPSRSSRVGNNSQIRIADGDTLYGVAKKYRVTSRDLIKYNNLTPPYILKRGDKLIIPAPYYYKVQAGDTLYGISRDHNMKINKLIEINGLSKPYRVKAGQRIRIAEVKRKRGGYNPRASRSAKKKSSSGFVSRTMDKFGNFAWPLRGKIISNFGPKSGGLYNDGLNIAAKEGTIVKSSKGGVVAYVGNELKGYGNLVIVKHSGGWITAYAHLRNSVVKRGQRVSKGETLGFVGSTGNVKSAQLYFGLRKGRNAVNPKKHLK